LAATALVACELLINTSHLDPDADGGGDGGHIDGRIPGDGSGSADADAERRDVTSSDGPRDATSEPIREDAPCPTGSGPVMVRAGNFCVDSTEVTTQQYQQFLNADAGAGLLPPQCAWKGGLDYGIKGPTTCHEMDCPVGNVDWCDAYAYCAWAGKRLCGDPAGGATPYGSYADPAKDQWFAACSRDGTRVYPYGNVFDDRTCNGELLDGGFPDGPSYSVLPVGSKKLCEGGYAGILDMSGNAAEWEDSCDDGLGGDAAAQPCHYRGGSAHSQQDNLQCEAGVSFGSLTYARSQWTDDVGFRCCSK
jgi:sulfatase modifying factor 1